MTRARLKPSPTDDYARKIARAISKGRPPTFGNEIEEYCEGSPREIFAAFAGMARHMPPAGKDEMLALGYLFLLQRLLEHLRFRSDRGFADAAKLIEDFQADVVARGDAGDVDGRVLALVGGALHQSKIPASPAFAEASVRHGAEESEGGMPPGDIREAIGGIVGSCDGDPFTVVEMVTQACHALPEEVRGAFAAELAFAGLPQARSAAVLFLLDREPAVRRAVAGALGRFAASLTPADVRRLIAMRNWRSGNERTQVDAVIRKARAAGVDCAQWEAGSVETIFATAVDGVAAQVFLLASPAGRKKRMSSVLTKEGIVDVWASDPMSRRESESMLAEARTDAPTLEVSRPYLDRAVAHHLALTVEKGETPSLGLLQLAEAAGGADWQPARMDFSEALAALIADVPKAMREPVRLASILRRSGELADIQFVARCWYEDGPQVAQAMEGAHVRRGKLVSYLLQSVIAKRRDWWAEIVLRTALWMREGLPEADGWRHLALVAKALADGRDMTEIGLMHEIALRTIAVVRNGGPE
jgi:hypothetical protein